MLGRYNPGQVVRQWMQRSDEHIPPVAASLADRLRQRNTYISVVDDMRPLDMQIIDAFEDTIDGMTRLRDLFLKRARLDQADEREK